MPPNSPWVVCHGEVVILSAAEVRSRTQQNIMDILTIYTPQTTNRIRYIFDLIFKEQLGIDYIINNSPDEFRIADGAKIAYAGPFMPDALNFGAVYLLFEKGVHPQDITVTEHNYLKIFFQVEDEDFCLPFDPFAAAFYLVSRYEEYLPHKNDRHGRFMAEESLAYKNGFLQIPIVNYYIQLIRTKINERYPALGFETKKFKYVPTFDVDSAFCYQNKGLFRNAGGLVRDLTKFDMHTAKERIKVMLSLQHDPFDTYDWILQMHKIFGGNPIFFFLVGNYGEYDKNISITMPEYQSLIKMVADQAAVGVHPSYASNENTDKLKIEIRRLQRILRRDIWKSRQHFLKLEFPRTYNTLIENDITQDYTMGYASQLGFRAGIASSFYYYSLDQENKTLLRIYPFAIMDATMQYYLKLTPEQAMEAMRPIIEEVKNVKGLLITLWHNNSFSEQNEWSGWRRIYEEMLKSLEYNK